MESDLVLAHLALDFCLGSEGGDGVDDDDIYGSGADDLIGNLHGLFAIVGLGEVEGVDIYAKRGGIVGIERMLSINEDGTSALLLAFGDSVEGERGLTARLLTIDFDDAPTGIASYAKGCIELDGARGDDFYLLACLVAKAHDGALAKLFLYLRHGSLQGCQFDVCRSSGSGFFFLCHDKIQEKAGNEN